MINCFDVESLSVLQKYHFKQTFLIGENVEEFIFDSGITLVIDNDNH